MENKIPGKTEWALTAVLNTKSSEINNLTTTAVFNTKATEFENKIFDTRRWVKAQTLTQKQERIIIK